MYKLKKSGWMMHFDFKLLDLFVMLISYFTIIGLNEKYDLTTLISGGIVLALFSLLVSIMTEMHDNVMYRRAVSELILTIIYVGACEAVSLVFLWFISKTAVSNMTAVLFIIAGIGHDFIFKILYKMLVKKGLSANSSKSKLIVVSSDDDIEKTIRRLNKHSFGQVEIEGVVVINSEIYKVGDKISGYEFVCEIQDLPEYIQQLWIDEVFINLPTQRAPYDVLAELKEMGIAIHRVINYDLSKSKTNVVEHVAGYTCLTESIRVMRSYQFFAKRLLDIIGGLIGSTITVFLILIFGPIIFFTDPGPIFFKQKRVGKGGRFFYVWKFRSMYKDAEARKAELMSKNNIKDGLMFKMDNDPRILGSGPDGTKKGIGWFIRTFSIDEFPQFFQVLKGDMSLVGTRPPTIDEWEKYKHAHRARMAIRPGITGMWQVSGRSNITDFEKVVELDKEYIRNMGVLFDIKLLLKTVKTIFTRDGAK